MNPYKDADVEVRSSKLTYFDVGYGIHPVLDILTPDPEKIIYQERAFNERALAYLDLMRGKIYRIIFCNNFKKANILYYLYNYGSLNHKLLIDAKNKNDNNLIQSDLFCNKNINYYDSFQDVLNAELSETIPTFFLIHLCGPYDLRSFIDYLSIQRDSFLMVMNYSEYSVRNERLYCMKNRLRLLEHLDQSADFIPSSL